MTARRDCGPSSVRRRRAFLLPSPLRGGGGGAKHSELSWGTPLPDPPPQGGRESQNLPRNPNRDRKTQNKPSPPRGFDSPFPVYPPRGPPAGPYPLPSPSFRAP